VNITQVTIHTTTNFTDEFRNVSATLRVGDWLAKPGGLGRHTLSRCACDGSGRGWLGVVVARKADPNWKL